MAQLPLQRTILNIPLVQLPRELRVVQFHVRLNLLRFRVLLWRVDLSLVAKRDKRAEVLIQLRKMVGVEMKAVRVWKTLSTRKDWSMKGTYTGYAISAAALGAKEACIHCAPFAVRADLMPQG